MIKAGIIGGAGYTGGELIRILQHHPEVEIKWIISRSFANQPVTEAHPDLTDLDMNFSEEPGDADVVFISGGHGVGAQWVEKLKDVKVVDLGNDFRLHGDHDYQYGLVEVFGDDIKKAERVANPGCFATAIQLALVPLANKKIINEDIHINAITGSTGAGVKPKPTTHMSWRYSNLSIYKAFEHQHLGEIEQTIKDLQPDWSKEVVFIPIRGPFPRGIMASMHIRTDASIDDFKDYYKDCPFVVVTDKDIDLKQVVNTNKCLIQVRRHKGWLHVTSMIDNLLKGASGQAVQNMNLMFGLKETTGLHLKPIIY